MIRSLVTAVIELDENLAVVLMNPSAETLLGLSERQAVGHSLSELLEPSEDLVNICERALGTGLTFGLKGFATKIGSKKIIVDCRAGSTENQRRLVLELNDTFFERKIRQEAELIAQQKLSRRIVRQLAHEIKNPLGGMRGAAQLLDRRLDDPELRRFTNVIIAEIDRLAALVDEMSTSAGRQLVQQVNPHEITEHVANLIDAEKPAGVQIVRDYDPSLPALRTDKNQMIQALLNIARNAMQAVGDSGTIVLRTRAISNATIGGDLYRLVVCIEVEDDGPGVPEELQETLFYPLVTGRDSGTGLGLTIAQDLVSRNHGLVEMKSTPGKTVFQLRLPLVEGMTAKRSNG